MVLPNVNIWIRDIPIIPCLGYPNNSISFVILITCIYLL